jgi:hypothetical protein
MNLLPEKVFINRKLNKRIMRKSIITIILVLTALLFVLPSCEKDNTVLLSDYIIGEWRSGSVDINGDQDDYYIFYADIEEDHYSMSLAPALEGGSPDLQNLVNLPDEGYTIDDVNNIITIDEPDFPGEEPSTGTVSFNVIWEEGSDVMTWEPAEDEPHGPPTIIWTRSTGS